MEFFDVLKNRHSIRSFKQKEIEEDKLKKIIEAAISAPSAGNLQSYDIVVVKNPFNKERIAQASLNQDFIAEAPVVLIFLANKKRASKYGKRGKELYCVQDATIAAAYSQLAAVDLGLSSVWIGAFDEEKIRKIIKAPDYAIPVAILPIGYPAEEPYKTQRRKDVIHDEKW
ncbi:MAG: nitroreductase family protein [Nanoarchaeota archaeon]|nr:nitroreductase family protein [Nanoarchaeota archaeon]